MKTAGCPAEQDLAMSYSQEVFYPIVLEFEYYVLDHGCIVSAGKGKTARISRRTIIFSTIADMIPGTMLQLIVRWPVLYQGKEIIKWIVQGPVSGLTADGLTLLIEHERLMRPAPNGANEIQPAPAIQSNHHQEDRR
jgi:hypothetical protein